MTIEKKTLQHEFVEFIPDNIEEGVVYVALDHNTAIHRCCCGCRSEIVTPLAPTGWSIAYNGKSVSLYPSIGNWSLPCQSHYWIRNNRIIEAPKWSKERIQKGREREKEDRERYYGGLERGQAGPEDGDENEGDLDGAFQRQFGKKED
jgi:hypothetical protein